MEVLRASTAGFCMGVSLALQKLEQALDAFEDKDDGRICTLGPIIHNPQALAQFAARGVVCLDRASDAREKDRVLIRAHGIPRSDEDNLRKRCPQVVDATCPKVKKAQLAIEKATKDGATLLLFGEAEHPEVRGLVSYARSDFFVFGSAEALAEIKIDPAKSYVLASQTTQDREIFSALAESLKKALPDLTILATICDATRQRQAEALSIASHVDAMVVIGGKTSGNTRRLANLSAQAGIETFHVETTEELSPADFADKRRIGLTAGASTPKSLIDAAEKWLKSIDANSLCKDGHCA